MPSLPSGLPVELGSMRSLDTQLSRLLRLAVAGGPSWSLARLLRRVVQIDGENSAGQTGLFLSALLGHSCAVRLLLVFGANPNHRCLDGSTPVHAAAFSGCSQVMLQLLQAGGDLRLHDQQGRTPRDWAVQGGARQSWEVVELLQLCRIHMSALLCGGELAPIAALGPLYTSSGHGPCGSLSSLMQSESLLWRGNPVTMRQLKAPGAHPDMLLADLQHCSTLHHPNLLLLMALSPSADLSGLCLLFEPVWLGSLHVVLHQPKWREKGPRTVPGLLPGHMLLQVLEALLFLQARCRAHGGLSSHAVQLVRPGLAKVGNLEHGRPLNQPCLRPRLQQGYPWGGPGTGLPPPPELYPWLPLELIHGDMPAATSDLYSFCILAQEVFTGELPWAGREGLEVKAKLEAGESPALDPLVPSPYQALVRAGLGLGPTDRWGSLQSTRYLLREAVAQDSDPEVSSPMKWTTLTPVPQRSPPEQMYYEVARRATIMPGSVQPSPMPSEALETPEVTGHSGVQRGAASYSSSSLTLSSSCSHSPGSSHSPSARVSLFCCLEPTSTAASTEPMGEDLFSSLQKPTPAPFPQNGSAGRDHGRAAKWMSTWRQAQWRPSYWHRFLGCLPLPADIVTWSLPGGTDCPLERK
ncbi:PREDICTED: inactive serine/threonine-protein kinase TEX14-like isoform X5 [Chinchilla lanigera]|uniref:inactive serine/threonine-protein kinase TEX14-like isoform X5 n=1 Tax=Chinchilla lanigera TaxID=34839 RepID=UPI000699237B|nr:PREDICTED: inactive serine/threonine-protein kinase TEX14-like isoform X5 [Chinchilla lanigera]